MRVAELDGDVSISGASHQVSDRPSALRTRAFRENLERTHHHSQALYLQQTHTAVPHSPPRREAITAFERISRADPALG